MKKIVLSLFVLLLTCVPVSAETNKKVIFEFDNSLEFVVESDVARGNAIYEGKLLNMPSRYDQNRYTEGTAGNCDGTIAEIGCAIVAFAEVRDYYYPQDKKDPSVVNEELKAAGLAGNCINFSSAAKYYGLFERVHKTSNYSIEDYYDFYLIVRKYVNVGQPVMFCVKNGGFVHWLVAYGYHHVYDSEDYVIRVMNTGYTEIKDMEDVYNKWPERYISEYSVIAKS